MDQAVLALEGAIAPMDCFLDDHDGRVLCSHGEDGGACATKLLWTRVQMGVISSLQRTTLAELVEFDARPTIEDRSPSAPPRSSDLKTSIPR
jgi:DNA-binding IscR family transcriptional regulator